MKLQVGNLLSAIETRENLCLLNNPVYFKRLETVDNSSVTMVNPSIAMAMVVSIKYENTVLYNMLDQSTSNCSEKCRTIH